MQCFPQIVMAHRSHCLVESNGSILNSSSIKIQRYTDFEKERRHGTKSRTQMLSSNRNRNDMRILVHLKISILLELHFDQ